MNWDWDKLQEKRQRQNWSFGKGNQGNDDRNSSSDGNGGGNNNNQPPRNSDPSQPSRPNISLSFNLKKVKWVALAAVVLWLLSGIYIVNPDEQGVVLRFGKFNRMTEPGPHYALPYPFETYFTPKVTQVQRVEVGFRSVAQGRTFQQGANRLLPEESAMLTGDENIVNVQFSVQYHISNPVEYLFNVTNQAAVVKNAAEAAMREVIGNSLIDSALTDGKLQIQNEATILLQDILDRYKVGVKVVAVQLQDVHPPKEVSDAFKDVASAREDKSRIVNEAEAYRNELIPKARGLAAEVINQAEAYKETRIRNAEGETMRFNAILKEYNLAKDVTKKRMYLETMEEILSKPGLDKIILPKGSGTIPLLPLMPGTPIPPLASPKNLEPSIVNPKGGN